MDLSATLPNIRAIKPTTVANSDLVSAYNFERILPCCFCCSVAWPAFGGAAGTEEQAAEEGFRRKGLPLSGSLHSTGVL